MFPLLFTLLFQLTVFTAEVPSNYVWGQTYERVSPWDHKQFIDLDNGKVVNWEFGLPSAAQCPWGDIGYSQLESHSLARVGFDLVTIKGSPGDWDRSPDEILDRLKEGTPGKEVRLGGHDLPQTWLFKTRDGTAGVLHLCVSPRAGQENTLLARFKQIRPRLQFAPVATNKLTLDPAKPYFLLDDGTRSATMPANTPFVYLEKVFGHWSLVLEPLHNYHTERERGITFWNTINADEISKPAGLAGLPMERKGFYELNPDHLPITVLIPTWGLLQITGIDLSSPESPAVTLRYKHIQE